jgi:single-stranded-DNA-specific exonuclease
LVYTFFKDHFAQCDFYIPDRNTEGYGISTIGIDWAVANGFNLVIALDCGIKSIDKIEYANQKNLDFIICDHHRPGIQIPAAHAVLDPKRADCNYPYKDLPGCGIGFKLVQAFAQQNNIPFEEVTQYLDLVAISIAADIVPVTGENRVLAYFGLQKLNAQPRPGIKAILELGGFRRQLTISDIVFTIAPRINAAGRMEHGKQAVALLISDNANIAQISSQLINKNNTDRREADKDITEQALEVINSDTGFLFRKSTVVFNPNWHKGVIGIVASRLTEKFYRPTVVLTQSNGYIAGSARSVKDFDVYNAVEACAEYLDQFGGHMYAAGLTMKPENLHAFKEKFEQVVSSTIQDHMLTPEIEIDAELDLKDITPKFYNVLKQFGPFGPGNMAPVFISHNVKDKGRGRVVGNNHLKLTIVQENHTTTFDSIAFQLGEHHPKIEKGKTFDVCYAIEENTFNGTTSIQLNIKDLKFESEIVEAG